MAFVRRKYVGGHWYFESVESYRIGAKVRHRHLESLGPEQPSLSRTKLISKTASANTGASKTFAIGNTTNARYEFNFKIVDAKLLITSNDPFTCTMNPDYPKELQPRLRDRKAASLQVMEMAAKLDAEVLLTDFKSLDRGAPIIGSDSVVESGNGRVMAVLRAFDEHPNIYANYKKALKVIVPNYSLSVALIDKLTVPVLVRERLTPVDRRKFVEEGNSCPTMEASPIEKAISDTAKITPELLTSLELQEGEVLADALRSPRNNLFVAAFLNTLPANEQARLLDSHGILNQDGVMRIIRAIFVAAFHDGTGLKLSEGYFESTDVNLRNCFNGITRSLGLLVKMEALIVKCNRNHNYSIGEDLAKATLELIYIKNTSGLTLEKYLAQAHLLERKLTLFQERVLSNLDQHSRSAKQIASILSNYCQLVIDSPPTNQMSLIPCVVVTKEELFETAMKSIPS